MMTGGLQSADDFDDQFQIRIGQNVLESRREQRSIDALATLAFAVAHQNPRQLKIDSSSLRDRLPLAQQNLSDAPANGPAAKQCNARHVRTHPSTFVTPRA